MDTRHHLQPYYKQRLRFEGVLIQIIPPNKQNRHNYNLIFASVYNKHHDIEIDHVVISAKSNVFRYTDFTPFVRYSFTATIDKYYKPRRYKRMNVQTEAYQLNDINPNNIEEDVTSDLPRDLSQYVAHAIKDLAHNPSIKESYETLNHHFLSLPNDGSREKEVNQMKQTIRRRRFAKEDIIDIIYHDDRVYQECE